MNAILLRNATLSMVKVCQRSNSPLSVGKSTKYLDYGEVSSETHSPLYLLIVINPWAINRWNDHWLHYIDLLSNETFKNMFRKW
jgi:hypothetical protein